MRILPFLLAVLLLPGCTPARRSADPVARDQEIARDLAWTFQKDPRFARIQVSCRDAVVHLAGPVTTADDKAEAESIARSTRSVASVVSELAVRSR